jgi:hypothetical protein
MLAPCAGRMKRIDIIFVENSHTPGAELNDVLLKGRVCCVRRVSERQRDYGKPLTDSFNQNAKRKCVTYSTGPFIDRIEGRRSNDNGVRLRQDIFRAWLLVIASHGVTRPPLECSGIDESRRGRGCQHADIPSILLRGSD